MDEQYSYMAEDSLFLEVLPSAISETGCDFKKLSMCHTLLIQRKYMTLPLLLLKSIRNFAAKTGVSWEADVSLTLLTAGKD